MVEPAGAHERFIDGRQIGLVLIGVPGSFYVTFIGVMLVLVVIANVHLGRFGSNQA